MEVRDRGAVSVANVPVPAEIAAVVARAPMIFGVERVALVPMGAGDVFVRTVATSISSGTEKMIVSGALPPGSPFSFPLIPGYETVGVVESAGGDAPASLIGQTVFVGGAMCYTGVSAALGGQSAGLIVPAERVLPLGDVPATSGVLLALFATAVHAVGRVGGQHLVGKTVAILGNGSLGRLLAAVVRQYRPARLIVTEAAPERYEAQHPDADASLLMTEGVSVPAGVDVLIDASGVMPALDAAIRSLVLGGDVVVAGYYRRLDLDYMGVFFKEPRLHIASQFAPPDLAAARDLLAAGIIDPARLLTHSFGANDIQAAYDAAFGDPRCVKVVIHWDSYR